MRWGPERWSPHEWAYTIIRRNTREMIFLLAMWGYKKKMLLCKPRRVSSWILDLLPPYSWTSQLIEPWEINVCSLSHQFMTLCYSRPNWDTVLKITGVRHGRLNQPYPTPRHAVQFNIIWWGDIVCFPKCLWIMLEPLSIKVLSDLLTYPGMLPGQLKACGLGTAFETPFLLLASVNSHHHHHHRLA